jgi:2-dehydro-3-deoxygluconokinase
MLSAVCVGETMAMLTPVQAVPLHQATELHCGIGGAESNVAMGLAAMGLDTHWVGRVGRDGFGTRILNELSSHGVGVSGVEVDEVLPTGLYVKLPAQDSESDGGSAVLYYRQGSAASAMGPATLANPAVAGLLEKASLIHLSGITAALSPNAWSCSKPSWLHHGTAVPSASTSTGGRPCGPAGTVRYCSGWRTWPTSSL